MKYTIEGFSQLQLLFYNIKETKKNSKGKLINIVRKLDYIHAALLRWFVDFQNTGKMIKMTIDNIDYFWIKYDYVLECLPILNIKKDSLYRRFMDLVECGILDHKVNKNGGTFSCYRLGKEYEKLINSCSPTDLGHLGFKSGGGQDLNPEGSGFKSGGGQDLNPEGSGFKSGTNINLLNNSSIKDSSIKDNTISDQIKEIIDYFDKTNSVTSRTNTNQFKEICNGLSKILEEYTVNDIKQVILFMSKDQWHIENKFNTLSVLGRPTRFSQKYERSQVKSPKSAQKSINTYEELKNIKHTQKISPFSGKQCIFSDDDDEEEVTNE